jgi:hypothetical protein
MRIPSQVLQSIGASAPKPHGAIPPAPPPTEDLDLCIARIERAAVLARRLRFDEAIEILGHLPHNPPWRARFLHLRARIYAQLRHHQEARRCWLAAVQLVPGEEAFLRGLQTLDRIRGGRPAAVRLCAALVLMFMVAGGAWIYSTRQDLSRRLHTTEQALDDLRAASRRAPAATQPASSPEMPR